MTQLLNKQDYLDNDVAYLLGMIMMRGTFHVDGDIRRLIIQFPYRNVEVKSVPNSKLKFDRKTVLRLSLDEIRRRINELLEVSVDVQRLKHGVNLVVVFTKNTMSWRNLHLLCEHKSNYLEFKVPDVIFEAPSDIQRDFIRGIVDTASTPSYSDRDPGKKQRVVIEFQNGNWCLPIQICQLLQKNLGIKVSHILWGHLREMEDFPRL